MALESGQRVGPYTIEAPLGAGGMGEVYRAHDPRLDRPVAIKVLSERFGADEQMRARFEHEARAVAALSHPNVLAVYDFGIEGDLAYVVLELLEGETLAARLGEGPLPARKAIEVGAQAARGLAAAHESGLVHRDVKPSNLFLTRDGQVKLLDFGLAKASEPATNDTQAATVAQTDPGTVMGTVGYMAPEQVRGEPADERSDLFALGAVIYEMVTGRRAFERSTSAETMTAILNEDPPELAGHGGLLPAGLERIVRRCLEKRPPERFQSARDLAFALEGTAAASGGSAGVSGIPARVRGRLLPWAALAAASVLGLVIGWILRAPVPSAGSPVKVRQLTFTGTDSQPSVSPDGRLVAFTSDRDGVSRIWLKQLAGGGEQPLTEGPDWWPRFSPDGSSVLFIREEGETQALYRTALVGGAARKLLDDVVEAAWSPDGQRIAFLRKEQTQDFVTTSLGILELEDLETRIVHQASGWDYLGLDWSSDGERVVLTRALPAASSAGLWGVIAVDVESGDTEVIVERGGLLTGPTFTPSGRTLVVGATPSTLGMVNGEPAQVLRVAVPDGRTEVAFWTPDLFSFLGSLNSMAQIAVLPPDGLVFASNRWTTFLREVTVAGTGPGRTLTRGSAKDRQPAYSPDGRSVVFSSNRSGNMDLFVFDIDSGELRQLIEGPAQDWDPAFTPDGREVLFSSDRSGNLEVWRVSVDGSDPRQVTTDGVSAENPTMTPNGEWIAYYGGDPAKPGLYRIRPDGSDARVLVEGFLTVPDVSPDGRYVVYAQIGLAELESTIRVVEVESGEPLPFVITLSFDPLAANVTYGRSRWWPDGTAIAFLGLDEQGRTGVFLQDFSPGEDTTASRRKLAGFYDDVIIESFGISPDGERVTLAVLHQESNLMVAEGVPGLE